MNLSVTRIALMCCTISATLHMCKAFMTTSTQSFYPTSTLPSTPHRVQNSLFYQSSKDNQDVVLYSDEDEGNTPLKNNPRWHSLSPSVKKRIIEEAHQRAIANKKKREPASVKKRRLLMDYKKAQQKNKWASRIKRQIPLNSKDRVPLSSLEEGEECEGLVISLTNFGAYIDVGSECDGLLHVSQITRKEFIDHPRQALNPGDKVNVRIVRVSPELKKMQLTMLHLETTHETSNLANQDDEDEEAILLEDLDVDDELWGEIVRVTSFGAYVKLGTEVDGWLHFMDHPSWVSGLTPKDFMAVGDRVRCWVRRVDLDMKRLQLDGNRPKNLPGPRREIRLQ